MTQSNPFEISNTAKQPTATETAPPSTGPVWHQYILLSRTMLPIVGADYWKDIVFTRYHCHK